MERHLFNKIEEMDYLVDYVSDTLYVSEAEITAAMDKMARERIPLERADANLSCEITKIVSDYCDDYCVDIDSVWEVLTIEDIIFKLKTK